MKRMLMFTICLLGLATWGCTSAAPTSSPTQTHAPPPTQAIDAAAIFRQNCAPCHGTNRQGNVGPDVTAVGIQSRGRTDEYIRNTITNGRSGMPSWKDTLTPAQIEALVRFLRT